MHSQVSNQGLFFRSSEQRYRELTRGNLTGECKLCAAKASVSPTPVAKQGKRKDLHSDAHYFAKTCQNSRESNGHRSKIILRALFTKCLLSQYALIHLVAATMTFSRALVKYQQCEVSEIKRKVEKKGRTAEMCDLTTGPGFGCAYAFPDPL